MGLYSFIPDAGQNFPEIEQSGAHTEHKSEQVTAAPENSNPEASERLEKLVTEYDLKVNGLSVLVEGETVHVKGGTATQADKERLILLLGNVQGISEVREAISVENPASESHFHSVARTDTLAGIAEKVLGTPEKSQLILRANAPFIKAEKDLYPGMVLRIPADEKEE